MVAETYKKDGDDWRLITNINYTDDTLTDRSITTIWYNDNGLWREVFSTTPLSLVNLDPATISGSRGTISGSGTATAAYRLTDDGIAQQTTNLSSNSNALTTSDLPGDNWWSDKPQASIGDDYEVMASVTGTSGAGVFSGTVDSWLALSSDRVWTLTDSGDNVERVSSRSLLVQIRDVATETVQDSASITLTTSLFGP